MGLTFSVEPSGVEEDAIKAAMKDAPIAELAAALARAKTLAVSVRHPNAYTIGADQICVYKKLPNDSIFGTEVPRASPLPQRGRGLGEGESPLGAKLSSPPHLSSPPTT